MAENGTTHNNTEALQANNHNHHNDVLEHRQAMRNGHMQIAIKQESKYSSYSSEDSEDSPLDFSCKKRKFVEHDTCGRESAPSSSSNADSSSFADGRKSSDPEDGILFNGALHNQDLSDRQIEPGEIKHPAGRCSPGTTAGLAGMMSKIHAGFMSPTQLLGGVFPQNMMDPRVSQQHNGSRPFKAYPKDPLAMSMSAYGLSHGYSPFQGMDTSMLQALNITGEEFMEMYKKQLHSLRERDHNGSRGMRHLDSTPKSSSHTSSPPSSSLINANNNTFSNGSRNSSPDIGNSPPLFSVPSSSVGMDITASGRKRPKTLPDEQKDEAYWERRRKNNDAAKRSRDARRAKEDQIAIRAALLEQENLKLRVEVAALKTETAKLRCMLYNS
ncbi:uncharacterized protein LOC110448012 [Mizuhopecten yessoensis]|uniref:Cell death specification protein 2 n=1 Tax=Mizuhopecten yessoensis TaxID=6573 RepID=A0A210QU40_MIZYE|nr:uncharacterized protein LOC110448012 [Mizuhopecten yessoensis]XP_021349706.1 uncharacterized protein LOC110448012 [Mizuhopecten yessoensis]XP_021349707.1 uncharacterized protein LOC110448012 [Mizuhopecten yessoensis]XP_021349708.1 uncharacterized protein LOC110448012 [Mizuhopecten yessoensis]XP_021349709.1 uncharacterized protein LOC110448012 [Mizuhopecten yessoensis]XP_021349710.1 uncharacterized protein LOC110448012 [Mizuhopecten yessoensis]XP_021349711.1 uncharacterized protein LOC11044